MTSGAPTNPLELFTFEGNTNMHYIVVCPGHIALFEQYEAAREFAADFNGQVFNIWGLGDRGKTLLRNRLSGGTMRDYLNQLRNSR